MTASLKFLILLYFISPTTALAEQSSLDLYKAKTQKVEEKLKVELENKNKIVTITVGNDSSLITNPIYPLSLNFLGRNDYEILKDSCSYTVLYPKKKCEIKLLNKENKILDLEIYPYAKESLKQIVRLGLNPYKTELVKPTSKEVKLLEKPLVERIGVEHSYIWTLDLPNELVNPKVVQDNPNLFAKIKEFYGKKLALEVFPKKEDFFDISIKIVDGDYTYIQPLKFTALVRKPLNLQITPNLLKVGKSKKPITFKVTATYLNGNPIEVVVPSYLVDWSTDKVQASGEFIPSEEGTVILKAKTMGLESKELNFEVKSYWPYGKMGDLVVKNNTTIKGFLFDYQNIIIEKNAQLTIESNNPWVFLGVKNKLVNNGKIKFVQKFSGDLSTNLPNYDGTLSGPRIELGVPQNNFEDNGGQLFINTGVLSGKGQFVLSTNRKANLGQLRVAYRELFDFSGNIITGDSNQSTLIEKVDNTIFLREEIKTETISKETNPNTIVERVNSAFVTSYFYIIRYLILAGLSFLLLYMVFYEKIKRFKIQSGRPENKQFLKEFFWSIISAGLINFLVAICFTHVFKSFGLLKIYQKYSDYSIWYYSLSFPLIIILHDLYFYFTHRILHTKYFYKIHKIHHESANPTPLTALSFHPLEAFMHFLFVPIVTILIPFHVDTIAFFLWAMLIFNVNGHTGYEYWPKYLRSGWRFKFLNNSIHHNMHHKYFQCNYSLYFNILDRIFKTNHQDYEEEGKKDV